VQLSDSALPVGAVAHSFGLETLVAEEGLTVARLELFLRDYLSETGAHDVTFCRAAYRQAAGGALAEEVWLELNRRLGARKLSREGRAASATLGRRFLRLVFGVEPLPLLERAARTAEEAGVDTHHAAAFGLACGALRLGEEAATLAYLHQTLAGLVSACQRLLPLGQTLAQQMLWRLKTAIVEASRASASDELDLDGTYCFTPLADLAAMRHPSLDTRLFIS
jgi:urease accessory protein